MSMNKKSEGLALKVGVSRLLKNKEFFAQVSVAGPGISKRRIFSIYDINGNDGRCVFEWLSTLGIPLLSRPKRTAILESLACDIEALRFGAFKGKRPTKPTVPTFDFLAVERGWLGHNFVSAYNVHRVTKREVFRAPSVKLANGAHLSEKSIGQFRKLLKRYGPGNALVKFAICASFVGPLLDLQQGRELPWFILVGDTSTGKSSLLKVMASVYGGEMEGQLGLLHSLSATTNAAEHISAGLRDSLLAFDDIQALPSNKSVRAEMLRDILFRTSAGREKARLGRSRREWRVAFAAASNEPLRAIFSEGGMALVEAAQVRAIELPCRYRHGIFDSVPNNVEPNAFVQDMVREATVLRGAAGERFIGALVKERHSNPSGLVAKLERWKSMAREELGADGVDGPTNRVIELFALVFASGCLAHEYGVTVWREERLLRAVKEVFLDHLEFTKGRRPVDPKRVLREFIKENHDEFISVRPGHLPLKAGDVAKALGIKHHLSDGTVEYCFLPEQFSAVFADPSMMPLVTEKLRAWGYLKVEGGKLGQGKLRPKRTLSADKRRVRVYCIDSKIMQLTAKANTAALKRAVRPLAR